MKGQVREKLFSPQLVGPICDTVSMAIKGGPRAALLGYLPVLISKLPLMSESDSEIQGLLA